MHSFIYSEPVVINQPGTCRPSLVKEDSVQVFLIGACNWSNILDKSDTDGGHEYKWTENNPAVVAFDRNGSNGQGNFLSHRITPRSCTEFGLQTLQASNLTTFSYRFLFSPKYKFQMRVGFKPYTHNDKRQIYHSWHRYFFYCCWFQMF